jgi:hypothetical protein
MVAYCFQLMGELAGLGIIKEQTGSYPQIKVKAPSYPCFRYSTHTGLHTPFKSIQVLDKKGENAAVHRKLAPLSTTTNLN